MPLIVQTFQTIKVESRNLHIFKMERKARYTGLARSLRSECSAVQRRQRTGRGKLDQRQKELVRKVMYNNANIKSRILQKRNYFAFFFFFVLVVN